MAKIQVIRPDSFGHPKEVNGGVYVKLYDDSARAIIPGTQHGVPVSGALAADLLGMRQEPCPNIGKMPTQGFHQGSYWTEKEGSLGRTVAVRCRECGYEAINPSQDQACHPEGWTRLTAKYVKMFLDEASWVDGDEPRLDFPSDKDDGFVLVFWMKSRWLFFKDRSLRQTLARLEGCKVLHENRELVVFQYRRWHKAGS